MNSKITDKQIGNASDALRNTCNGLQERSRKLKKYAEELLIDVLTLTNNSEKYFEEKMAEVPRVVAQYNHIFN